MSFYGQQQQQRRGGGGGGGGRRARPRRLLATPPRRYYDNDMPDRFSRGPIPVLIRDAEEEDAYINALVSKKLAQDKKKYWWDLIRGVSAGIVVAVASGLVLRLVDAIREHRQRKLALEMASHEAAIKKRQDDVLESYTGPNNV